MSIVILSALSSPVFESFCAQPSPPLTTVERGWAAQTGARDITLARKSRSEARSATEFSSKGTGESAKRIGETMASGEQAVRGW